MHKYIKTWDYKTIFYILLKLIFEKVNKLILLRKERIFMGYNKYTISHYRIYISNIYKMIILNNINFYKNIPKNLIRNYQL
jgi:hypothetical protein